MPGVFDRSARLGRAASDDDPAKCDAISAPYYGVNSYRGGGARLRFAFSQWLWPSVRPAGYTDAQIIEIIAVVAENIYTNMVNIVAGTEIDFPVVLASEAA